MATAAIHRLSAPNPQSLGVGASFGVPWPKGLYKTGQRFSIRGENSADSYPLDSREIAFWPDGTLKWTAHSISGHITTLSSRYLITGTETTGTYTEGVSITQEQETISISTKSGLQVTFPSQSDTLFSNVSLAGRPLCTGAAIIASINKATYSTSITSKTIENSTPDRAVVKVSGILVPDDTRNGTAHLPFDARVYVYSDARAIRIMHSFVHDLEPDEPLTSLGLRFSVPFYDAELYNRHVRLSGSCGGVLREEVQGLSGLRFGPKVEHRQKQNNGEVVTLDEEQWDTGKTKSLSSGLACIPSWDAYTLSQLSSDGFTIKKRTKKGCSWVKVNGGSRSDGAAYVGSAAHGGLAVGLADFWERYPTQLDLSGLTQDHAEVTVWSYSPLAEPLETMPYHDGLGLDTYEEQLEALNVTYEDYEPGFATANGIGRSNDLLLGFFTETPSNEEFANFAATVRDPPRMVPTAGYMHTTGVFHGYWAPEHRLLGIAPTTKELSVERNLRLLFDYYRGQVEQHRWYGFLDYGDVQHSYDAYRHAWRYDVGGYAWDNSELSTDLWLWLYFLHTGCKDVFKMAEAMTRHTSEVDTYHSGRFKGFGTRHGVQHFSDSSKQLRISNVFYRRIYYYLTGDERTGDLIEELQSCQDALLALDSHRKVQEHGNIPDGFAMANIGLDCGPLAASWLTAWERRTRDWQKSRDHLIKMLQGLATNLTHGIGNNACLLNPHSGEIRECPPPTPSWAISHLSMLFGFPETITEVLDYARSDYREIVAAFKTKTWLPYCRSYNASADVQKAEYGFEFPANDGMWRQSHATLTAIAAVEEGDGNLGKAAWEQFFLTDGYREDHEWTVLEVDTSEYFNSGMEAPWVLTNESARYGVSALFMLAHARKYLS